MNDYLELPSNLPSPADDGAADHLAGTLMPSLSLSVSDGRTVDVSALGSGRSIVYIYPLTGRPGVDLPAGWDEVPGARGCTPEACGFRDHYEVLRVAGADHIYGLSSQSPAYQDEFVKRLQLPFPMLSDEDFSLQRALKLPIISTRNGERFYARITLVVRNSRIQHAFYPVFPPNDHAREVLAWMVENP